MQIHMIHPNPMPLQMPRTGTAQCKALHKGCVCSNDILVDLLKARGKLVSNIQEEIRHMLSRPNRHCDTPRSLRVPIIVCIEDEATESFMPQTCRKRSEDADMSNIKGKFQAFRECTVQSWWAVTGIGVIKFDN